MGTSAEVVRRLINEAWTGRNVELVDELVSAEYVEQAPFGTVEGRDGYREGIDMFVSAFSPVELDVHDTLEEGERVAARFTFRGRHSAEFLGIPPSGSDVSMDGITITRLEDGKVAEEWLSVDWYGLMQQIGAIPADEAGGA